MSDTQQAYRFSSKPHPVQASRKGKGGYREGDDGGNVNIMHDRRVFRGSTYANNAKHKGETEIPKGRQNGHKNRKHREEARSMDPVQDGTVAPPVPGRKNIDIQTDTYLEELTDRVPETTTETQTDPFMDRPAIPLFMPAKIGIDTGTQVDVDELFDFDAEVEPILEVLVGKTLEHAMMEVLEEEELAAIRAHQEAFEQERNVERAQVQRLEAEAVRRREEKYRRISQEEQRKAREAEVMDKVAARAFAKDYLDELHTDVFEKLVDNGKFYDPLIKEVEDVFLPWLVNSVKEQTNKTNLARNLSDYLIHHTLERARKLKKDRLDEIEERKKLEKKRREKAERKRKREEERQKAELAKQQAAAAANEE